MSPSVRSFCWGLLALLLMDSAPAMKAQEAQMSRSPGALAMGSSLGFAAAFPVIKNEPYRANVLTQEIRFKPDGSRTVHEALNIYMRDSAGRIRDEQIATPPDLNGTSTQRTVRVFDPISMRDIQWNIDTKSFVIGQIPSNRLTNRSDPVFHCSQGTSAWQDDPVTRNPDQAQTVYEDLGERKIEGIRAQGCRITRTFEAKPDSNQPSSSVTEIWASPELQVNLLAMEHYSDGTERMTRLSSVRRSEPDLRLFQVPEDIANARESTVVNTNPNYQKIREYGRIEWHGDTATLVAAGSRPLYFVAQTLSTCLGVPVSSEDPRYLNVADLLDVTAPEWAAQHPDRHAYASRPGKVEVLFNVGPEGLPSDLRGLLQEAAQQVNQQQSYGYQVYERIHENHSFYSFVPTTSHDAQGILNPVPAYLDQKVTIPQQTTTIASLASSMSQKLSDATGLHFDCCQSLVIGQPWGMKSMTYGAIDQTARSVLEDLIANIGNEESYALTCEPLDKRFCFITVRSDVVRKPATVPQGGVCSALGYDGY
jgi:hypothetical protein